MHTTTAAPGRPAAPASIPVPPGYRHCLDLLVRTASGEARARILESMAAYATAAASRAARGSDDSLAWHDTASLLRQVAAAERGCVLVFAETGAGDHYRLWEDLALAGAAERDAALTALTTALTGQLRAAAVGRALTEAAAQPGAGETAKPKAPQAAATISREGTGNPVSDTAATLPRGRATLSALTSYAFGEGQVPLQGFSRADADPANPDYAPAVIAELIRDLEAFALLLAARRDSTPPAGAAR